MDEQDETGGGATEGMKGRRAHGSRLAFAAAVTVAMVGTFVSLGGASYAGSEGSSAVHAITKVVTAQKVVVHNSSASDQYHKKPLLPPKQTPPSNTGPGNATQGKPSGALPFTGFSLLGTAIASALLLALGVYLRRRARRAS